MSDPVARLAAQAVNERSHETLLEAFIAAARFCAAADAAGDVRDGLLAMPLPFDAAERLGADADELVEEAAAHLHDDEEAQLRAYAARTARADLGAMNWQARDDDGLLSYHFHW